MFLTLSTGGKASTQKLGYLKKNKVVTVTKHFGLSEEKKNSRRNQVFPICFKVCFIGCVAQIELAIPLE